MNKQDLIARIRRHRDQGPQEGRNPLTSGTIRIPKRKAVRFSAGKALKKAVN